MNWLTFDLCPQQSKDELNNFVHNLDLDPDLSGSVFKSEHDSQN